MRWKIGRITEPMDVLGPDWYQSTESSWERGRCSGSGVVRWRLWQIPQLLTQHIPHFVQILGREPLISRNPVLANPPTICHFCPLNFVKRLAVAAMLQSREDVKSQHAMDGKAEGLKEPGILMTPLRRWTNASNWLSLDVLIWEQQNHLF